MIYGKCKLITQSGESYNLLITTSSITAEEQYGYDAKGSVDRYIRINISEAYLLDENDEPIISRRLPPLGSADEVSEFEPDRNENVVMASQIPPVGKRQVDF